MRKAPGFGRVKSFKSKAIYANQQDSEIEKNKAIIDIIIGKGNFAIEDLDQFLSKLN